MLASRRWFACISKYPSRLPVVFHDRLAAEENAVLDEDVYEVRVTVLRQVPRRPGTAYRGVF